MNKKFDVIFLTEAVNFLRELDEKTRDKIVYNIDKSAYNNDPKLFKKISEHIWEFRTLYRRKQYRLLAFWDTTNNEETLVIATHGFVKKTDKLALKELKKTENIRRAYFEE